MQIKEIHIYGYGKFESLILHPDENLQVFFGENEAGKSTIMAFIQNILFGFPTKVQNERRFEPKTHSKYGGQLIIEAESWGEAAIERVRGKAAGDVKVLLKDGTVGGEELLARILAGIDKSVFQAIFSFSVHGLQQVHRLSKEDIGKYLFSAGTMGTDRIFEAQRDLQKEMDDLFKPSGRKPLLNKELEELRELERMMKKARHENEKYTSLTRSLEKNEGELESIAAERDNLQQKLLHIQHLQKMMPVFHQYNRINKRLVELEGIHIPSDGHSRLEKTLERIQTAENEWQSSASQIAEMDEYLLRNEPDPNFQNAEAEITKAAAEWQAYLQWKEDSSRLSRQLEDVNRTLELNSKELHLPPFTFEEWAYVQAGLEMKAAVKETVEKDLRLNMLKEDLVVQKEREAKKLAEMDKRLDVLENDMFSEEDFRELEKSFSGGASENQLREEWNSLNERVKDLTIQSEWNKNQYKSSRGMHILFMAASFALLIWGFMESNMILTGAALLLIVLSGGQFWMSRKKMIKSQAKINKKKELLKNKADSLSLQFQSSDSGRFQEQKAQHDYQIKLRNEWKMTLIQLEEQQGRCSEGQELLDKWQKEWSGHKQKADELKRALKLSESFPVSRLEDAFNLVKESIAAAAEGQKLEDMIKELSAKILNWEDGVKSLGLSVGVRGDSAEEMIVQLKRMMKAEEEKKFFYREGRKKLDQLKEARLKLKTGLENLRGQLNDLLNQASVKDEEEFRQKAEQFKEKEELLKELSLLEMQLSEKDLEELASFRTDEGLFNECSLIEAGIKECEQQIRVLQRTSSELRQEIKIMEEGGVYTELMHRFNYQKSLFQEKAKQWASLSAAKRILEKTTRKFEEERFPKVILEAERFLQRLTNGEYLGIIQQKEQSFMIKRKDGLLFEPSEVSQATSEQIYTSFRFALVSVLKEEYPLPLIIDDAFVHFDQTRMSAMAEILHELSSSTQILFFTCHSHLKKLFQAEKIIELESGTLINS
ncbi:AAA family ATPase [Falsibacillus pallidus]|uniref:ATP-binding protein n=1 Tax=Falsibacillus pallidus TaxID=493781 RepID=UPI003D995165